MREQEMGTSSQIQEKKEKDMMRNNILDKLDIVDRDRPPTKSIFQVPNKLCKFNEDSYSPRVVSIGPIHHGKSELLAMEELKWSYVNSFFCRAKEPGVAFDECVEEMVKVEETARTHYACDFNGLSKYQLIQILLVDGCFILELLLRDSNQYKDKGVINKKEDPILKNDSMICMLQQDLVLLENQIPFIVLEILLGRIDRNIPSSYITRYALVFFGFRSFDQVHINMHMEEAVANVINLHLLQSMHNYYLVPPNLNIDVSVLGEQNGGFEHCATQLHKGGINFEKASSENLVHIEFDENTGVIRIPQLRIGGTVSSLVRNLIAFEQCNFRTRHHMTAYVMVMGSLVSSQEDVEFLKREGILQLESGSHEEVLSYFRNMCAVLTIPSDYYFDDLCRRVNKYRTSRWNWRRRRASVIVYVVFTTVWWRESMATMKRDYCPNPFKKMSVMAAFVLLLFTGLQTFYSVRSYYPH